MLPSQLETHHRVLYRLASEMPAGDFTAESMTDEWDGVTRHYVDGVRVAADFPAGRFSPGDIFEISGWGNPADFSPAPALAMKWAGKGGDGPGPGPGVLTVEKSDDGRLFVSGPCYVAGEPDTDGEFFRQSELKDYAHSLMTLGSRKADADHDRVDREGISLVESAMVRKGDDGYILDPEGETWFVKYEVTDPVIKARVALPADDPNSLNAFSWDGLVRKRVARVSKSAAPVAVTKSEQLDATKADDDEAVELYDGRCIRVSLVHRGANRRMFAVASKSADADDLLRATKATKPPTLVERLKSWARGDEDNPMLAAESLDAALADFHAHAIASIGGDETALRDAAKALGQAVTLKAREAMTAPLNDPRGSWFTPAPTKEQTMTPEQIEKLVAEQVAAAVKAQTPETPADKSEDNEEAPAITVEDVQAAAKAAAEQAIKAEREAHAEALKALEEKHAAELAEVKKTRAPVPAPQAGGGDAGAETEGQKSSIVYGRDLNAEAREAAAKKYKTLGYREDLGA